MIEYSDNYSKTSGILWQHCRDKPAEIIKSAEIFK